MRRQRSRASPGKEWSPDFELNVTTNVIRGSIHIDDDPVSLLYQGRPGRRNTVEVFGRVFSFSLKEHLPRSTEQNNQIGGRGQPLNYRAFQILDDSWLVSESARLEGMAITNHDRSASSRPLN